MIHHRTDSAQTRTRGPSRRGSIAIVIIMALVMLQIVVVGIVLTGARDSDLRTTRLSSARAFYAADTAMHMALRELALNTDFDNDGAIGTLSNDKDPTTDLQIGGTSFYASSETVADGFLIHLHGSREFSAHHVQLRTKSNPPVVTETSTGGRTGLFMQYFTAPENVAALSQINWEAPPIAIGVTPDLNFPQQNSNTPRFTGGPTTNWGARFQGSILIPEGGDWTFWLTSDDGSRLIIDGATVINHDGQHTSSTLSAIVPLVAGPHSIEVLYFNQSGNNALSLSWSGPTVPSQTIIPARAFRCTPTGVPQMAVNGSMEFWGNGAVSACHIDAFDSGQGPYGGANAFMNRARVSTNSTSASIVQMASNAMIHGDLAVGPGGNPQTGIVTWSGSGISGTRSALPQRIAIITPATPRMPASQGWVGLSGAVTLSSDMQYAGLQIYGDTTVVTVVGHRIVAVQNDFQMSGASRLEIAPDSSLTLYVGGGVGIYGQSRANANTGLPDALRIFMHGNNRDLMLTETTRMAAEIWNPRGAVRLHGNCELSAVIYANSFAITESCRVHLDDRISGESEIDGESGSGNGGFTIAGWSEAD